jgi:hypothetical protein
MGLAMMAGVPFALGADVDEHHRVGVDLLGERLRRELADAAERAATIHPRDARLLIEDPGNAIQADERERTRCRERRLAIVRQQVEIVVVGKELPSERRKRAPPRDVERAGDVRARSC